MKELYESTEAKGEKYEELQQKFMGDEISREEMESEMERLLETGEAHCSLCIFLEGSHISGIQGRYENRKT